MPAIVCAAFFKDDDGNGWSERHCIDGGVSAPALSAFLTNFDDLMTARRVPLLGLDTFYIGCRVSYKTADRKIASAVLFKNPPVRGPLTYQGLDVNTMAPEETIKMRMQNAGRTNSADTYIRGSWHAGSIDGVLNFGGILGTQLKIRLDSYAADLIAKNYGWLGIDTTKTSRGDVTNYAVGVDGRITFTLQPTNGVALPTPTPPATTVSLDFRFAKLNDSKSVLNRTLVCDILTPTSIKTRSAVAAGDFTGGGTYVAKVDGLIPYAILDYYKLGAGRRAVLLASLLDACEIGRFASPLQPVRQGR